MKFSWGTLKRGVRGGVRAAILAEAAVFAIWTVTRSVFYFRKFGDKER